MVEINRSAPVMVSGATGYVAGWIVKRLLDEGMTVHAAVRAPKNEEKLSCLNAIVEESKGSIRYFPSDLLVAGSYQEAMRDCELVFHTASPFAMSVENPQKQLIDPALQGTRNVLLQANHTESVKRVVLTSSCAAMYGDNIDLQQSQSGILTEVDWNSTSSLTHNPYSYSKMLAEREAWKISKAQQRWDLVVINPSFVIGPGINPHGTSESFHLMKQYGDGTFRLGMPDWGMGVVDVRDLAEAHFRAGFTPSASGRYIISGYDTSFPQMAETLVPKFGSDYPLPRRITPKWIAWLIGPILNKSLTRRSISRNVGYPFHADNSKSVKEFRISYRPFSTSMNDFFQQLVDNGVFVAKTHE